MASVSRTPSSIDRARTLLTRVASESDGVASRVNVVNELEGTGHAAEADRRAWLEAWQLLQRAGLLCPTLDNPRSGDWWFVTSAGSSALRTDFEGELTLRLPRL